MEKISVRNIKFNDLEKLSSQGTNSVVYKCNNDLIKIFKGLSFKEKLNIYKLYKMLDGINIEGVILPKQFIMKHGFLVGYVTDFVDKSICVSDKYEVAGEFVVNEYFKVVEKASKILREIHNHGIIVQDFSFENILINELKNCYFIDFDSSLYKGVGNNFVSYLFYDYMINYRKDKVIFNDNLDKISMMLSFFQTFFNRSIQYVSRNDYENLEDKIKTLKNLKEIALLLWYKSDNLWLKEIPYLDEVIDLNDKVVLKKELHKIIY